MRRVLHVLAPAAYGGLEQVVRFLAEAQHAAGNDVSAATIINARTPEPELLNHLRQCGIRVIPIDPPSRSYVTQIRALQAISHTLRPDVIHSHGYVTDVLLGVSRSSVRGPVLSTVHGFTGGGRKNRAFEWMQRRALRRLDAVVAVSTKLGSELQSAGLHSGRVHVIPNAYPGVPSASRTEARRVLDIPMSQFSIGWIGRVSYEKGLDVLIDAASTLQGMDWRLTVVGDGSERHFLQRRVTELGISHRVRWHGAVANAAQLVQGFDVLVISSRTEGTPITLLEAMWNTIPLVTTAVGGIPDVVSSREALLVPPNDAGALVTAIRAVGEDPTAARERASRAFSRVRREFAIEPFLARYDRVYDTISTRGQ